MPLSPVLLFHICTATVALLSAALAMSFRKGSGLHGAAGTICFLSMLGMSASGAYMSAFVKPVMINVVVGLLTFYLVATAWWAAKRRDGGTGIFDVGALGFALTVGAASLTFGLQAANSQSGLKDQIPAGFYFFYGSISLLFAAADVRMLVRGGVWGAPRIARHLWRMCLALLIATVSLFPGQQRLLAQWLRESIVLRVPHLLLIGSMTFWMFRVLGRKSALAKEQV